MAHNACGNQTTQWRQMTTNAEVPILLAPVRQLASSGQPGAEPFFPMTTL